jgi:hypothetical protein
MNIKRMIVWFVGVAFCAVTARAAVTTESLLEEMVDLERLTRLPSPIYVTKQFSSYDRKSKSPTEEWFANGDRGQYLRVEKNGDRDEYVMMDAEGPGAIVRIWSANPDGIIRIYLDGRPSPIIETEAKALLGGTFDGIPIPFGGERAKGWNLYFPIAYARSCKVTIDRKNLYYHVNYRTYAPNTELKSFEPAHLKTLSDKINKTAHQLSSLEVEPNANISFPTTGGSDEKILLHQTDGPKVIRQFTLQFKDDMSPRVRELVLDIDFDGEHTVEVPLIEFFGTAPVTDTYKSLPFVITRWENFGYQMTCRWPLPYQREVKMQLRNFGSPRDFQVVGHANLQPYTWDEKSLLFHAKRRIERDIPVRPPIDWTHLDCKGTGRFVGSAFYIFNPVERWWGEGDEKIYVDGESFPSHFGTGTEDYYGYAWCRAELFSHAYHNQPHIDGPGNRGFTSNNRWHIIDDIPFKTSFKFDMENLHHHGYKNLPPIDVTRAAVSYWYARPGGTDTFKPINSEDIPFSEPRPKPESQPAG